MRSTALVTPPPVLLSFMQDPFGDDPNDLPMEHFQYEFNCRLMICRSKGHGIRYIMNGTSERSLRIHYSSDTCSIVTNTSFIHNVNTHARARSPMCITHANACDPFCKYIHSSLSSPSSHSVPLFFLCSMLGVHKWRAPNLRDDIEVG